MKNAIDTVFVTCFAIGLLGLSITTLSRTDVEDPTEGWRNGAYQRGYESRFETSLPLQGIASITWAALRWHLLREPSDGAVVGRGNWLFTAEEFKAPADPNNLEDALLKTAMELGKNQIILVPVIVPDKARVHSQRLVRGRSAMFNERYDRTLRTIQQLGLRVVDLRPALDFPQSFMRTDTHWSPRGAEKAAQAIAEVLSNIPYERQEVETTKSGRVSFEGDLESFVNNGNFNGSHSEFVETYETTVAAADDLFGDVDIPFALVGTSYSANPAFHFEGFLKQHLQAEVLNASVVGQGPFTTMKTFLSELPDLASPPSVVIWEIPERYLSTRSNLL